MPHGPGLMANGSWLKGHGSSFKAHGQEKMCAGAVNNRLIDKVFVQSIVVVFSLCAFRDCLRRSCVDKVIYWDLQQHLNSHSLFSTPYVECQLKGSLCEAIEWLT